jgi:hypothetical protein
MIILEKHTTLKEKSIRKPYAVAVKIVHGEKKQIIMGA